jgi:hypothetical protein
MRTVTNFKALGSVAGDQQLKMLAQAVSFELGLVNAFLDVQGGAAKNARGLHLLGAHMPSAANDPVSLEAVKGYLAQKYTTAADTPTLSDTGARVQSFFHTNMPELDLAWTNLFQLVDLRGSTQDHFDIIGTNAGLSFSQLAPGQPIKVRRDITEAVTTVGVVEYGEGLGILDRWLQFQQFWNVEQAVAEFRAKAWDKMAEIHYGLFTALSSAVNVVFDTDDTKTFNNAAGALFRAVRSSGYAVGQNAGLWIVTSPEQKGRVLKMLEATQGSLLVANQANAQPIAYNVAGVIASTYVAANASGYYLVLPGRKMQRGNWKDLTLESTRDIYAGAQDWVGRMQFNAAIGDTAQVRRVLFD